MSNLEKWIRAILNEDADNLSIGSVRTLQMIKQEFKSKEQEIAEAKKEIAVFKEAIEILTNTLKVVMENRNEPF